MTKKEMFFFGGFWFCFGIITGFMIAPIKKGMKFFSENSSCFNADSAAEKEKCPEHKKKEKKKCKAHQRGEIDK